MSGGTFDRIVSVGMFEHVGVNRYDEFFTKVRGLLKDDGLMLLHSIGRNSVPGVTNPWIRKYIFPGGYIPSLSEVLPAIEGRAGLYVTDIEILRLHYADTLRAWREQFMARRDEAAKLYDERLCRMWEFYLAGSETSFRVDGHMVFQIQLAKRQENVPLTRDYIPERGDGARRREAAHSAEFATRRSEDSPVVGKSAGELASTLTPSGPHRRAGFLRCALLAPRTEIADFLSVADDMSGLGSARSVR